MQDWTPIKKVAAGFVASAIAYVAKRAGIDLGPEEINEAAIAFVGVVVAYLVPER